MLIIIMYQLQEEELAMLLWIKIKSLNITDNKSLPIGIEIKNSYGSNMWGIKTEKNKLFFRNEDYLVNKEIVTMDITGKMGVMTTNPKIA
jgi:fluoride ion exporter CrcB/FEX